MPLVARSRFADHRDLYLALLIVASAAARAAGAAAGAVAANQGLLTLNAYARELQKARRQGAARKLGWSPRNCCNAARGLSEGSPEGARITMTRLVSSSANT
jgi:hypothetical protein